MLYWSPLIKTINLPGLHLYPRRGKTMKRKLIMLTVITLVIALSGGNALAKGKKVLAVDEFKNSTSASWWRTGVGSELSGMLTNELGASGKFKMVERKKIDSVLREQNLGASGRIRKGTAAKIGKLTGAQYLIMGTVSAYEEGSSSTGGGLSFGGISIGGKSSKAYIAVDLRVVDTTTGDVDFMRTIEANAKSGGLSFGFSKGGLGGALGGEKKTPAGKAIRACIIEISEYLECVMVDKGSCIDEYNQKESKRRAKTKSAIDLDD